MRDASSFAALSAESPWPGLRPFTEQDHDFFFGREDETKELLRLVQQSPVVVLHGRSGLGKTSLLQAGLFPELKDRNFLPVVVRLDYSPVAAELDEQIKQRLAAALDAANLVGPRPGADERLWEYFHRRDLDFWGPKNRLVTPVIVLDQFEEIFTIGRRADVAARVRQFRGELESVIEHRAPEDIGLRLDHDFEAAEHFDDQQQAVRFIISLREDFLAYLTDWSKRMPSLLEHMLHLSDFTDARALNVIAKTGGKLVTGEVARDIVVFLSASKLKPGPTMDRPRVEPALLSVVCDELNRRRLEHGADQITADLLSGSRDEIIQSFYDRSFEGIDTHVREWIEDQLLTKNGYRTHAAQEDARAAEVPEPAIDTLVKRRLLHRDEHDGILWLELSHDLITGPATLARAIRAERRESDAAKQRAAETAEQLRKSRRMIAAVTSLAALLLVAMIGLAVALVQSKKAKDAALRAQEKSDEAAAAEQSARKNSDFAKTSFKNVFRLAESLAFAIDGQMWTPTATLRSTTQKVAETYKTLSSRPTPELPSQHARFLATTAEALYQTGHITEGWERAKDAAEVLRAAPNDGTEPMRLARAQAEVAWGEGNLEFGKLAEAEGHLERAAQMMLPLPIDVKLKPDVVRTYVFAKIGLAKTANGRLDHQTARRHLQDASHFIDASGISGIQAEIWKATTELHTAMATDDYAMGYRRLTRLRSAMARLQREYSTNPVVLRLSADVDYQCGLTELRFKRYQDAEASLSHSRETNMLLTQRDHENLEWRLALGRSWRGLALLQSVRAPFAVQESLDKARKIVESVYSKEPRWIRVCMLYGAVIGDYGQAALERSRDRRNPASETLDTSGELAVYEITRANHERDAAAAHYERARAIYEQGLKDAPEYVAYIAEIARVRHGQASLAFSRSDPNRALDSERSAIETVDTLPADRYILEDRGRYQLYAGRWQIALGHKKEAIEHFRKALADFDAVQRSTTVGDEDVAIGHFLIAYAYTAAGEKSEALSHFEPSRQAIDRALRKSPSQASTVELLEEKAEICDLLARVLSETDNLPGAVEALSTAMAAVKDGLEISYGDSDLHQELESLAAVKRKIDTSLKTMIEDANERSLKAFAVQQQSESLQPVTVDGLIHGHAKSATWTLRPLIPGVWHNVQAEELRKAKQHLPPAQAARIMNARKLALSFYDDAVLYESEISWRNEPGIVDWVVVRDTTIFLDGRPDALYALNQRPPRLDDIDRVTAYLRFFIGAFNEGDGRSILVDGEHDLAWAGNMTAADRRGVASTIRPLKVERSAVGSWQAIGTIQYGGCLFPVIFEVKPDGSVLKHLGRNIFIRPLPLVPQFFVDGVRQNETNEQHVAHLLDKLASKDESKQNDARRELPRVYSRLKRWDEAVRAQTQLVDFLSRSNVPTNELTDAYLGLSWYQLMRGDYAGALASTEAGKKLDPYNLSLDTNRAHALLLLKRNEDAEKLYKEHRKKKVNDRQTWEDVILQDFKDLEGEGVFTSNESIKKIRTLFASSEHP